ncbi:uncharacterized protein LOC132984998 [Labrus mixtus]|uniref:uncharacterized protein LOC132984998 n=1 Tax=Labrus mixtus TaxID=508554 RepID=UPI0029C049DF|nr:uncharacterized protein LOC132984998 [Labrus mixtus]
MTLPMLSRKRPLCNGYDKEPPLYTKKCLASLKTLREKYQRDRDTEHFRLKTAFGSPCFNGGTKHLTDTQSFYEQISSWTDTQYSVRKVLERLKFTQSTDDIFLSDSVNKKFLAFLQDITEECGSEDKQHSWAVIEKQEEVVMYGPYYPNYNNGLHSEDIIIKQTEELLQSQDVSEDWTVFVFTMNSPCLARNTDPCMLNLVQTAHTWWSVYGVKTHIGYMKCWGFKGTKENLFRDINYSQVDCIDQSQDYESYLKATEKKTDLNPVCENMFSAVKHLLKSTCFPSLNMVQEQDWSSYFTSMLSIYECKPEEEKEILTQDINSVVEAAQALFSETSGCLSEYLDRGRAFAMDYTFSSQLSDAVQDQIRLAFHECWRDFLQNKHVTFVKETLTEDFNRCAVQLFIKDVEKFAGKYLQVGRLQFSEDVRQGVSNQALS